MNKINLPCDQIFEFQYDETLVDAYLNSVIDNDKDGSIKWSKRYVTDDKGNTFMDPSTNQVSFGYPIPKDEKLLDWFNKSVNEVSQYCFGHQNLAICDAWLTKTTFTESSHPHHHNYSLLSGLFYLHDSTCYTSFYGKNIFYENFFRAGLQPVNNQLELKINPTKGKLLIFPSYIVHRISTNRTKQTRYTLAFNTFLNGLISDEGTKKLNIQTLL